MKTMAMVMTVAWMTVAGLAQVNPPYGAFTNKSFQIGSTRIYQAGSVERYGAKGDGATDDTAAIKATLAWAASVGTTNAAADVVFPRGRYRITSSLPVQSNVRLLLQGASIEVASDFDAIVSSNSFNVTVDGGTFVGVGAASDSHAAVNFGPAFGTGSPVTSFVIRNLTIKGYDWGVRVGAYHDGVIENINYEGPDSVNGDIVALCGGDTLNISHIRGRNLHKTFVYFGVSTGADPNSNVTVTDCAGDCSPASAVATGIGFRNARNVKVSGVVITNSYYSAVFVQPSAGETFPVEDITISDVQTVRPRRYGLYINGIDRHDAIKRVTVSNYHIESQGSVAGYPGVLVAFADGVTLNNASVQNSSITAESGVQCLNASNLRLNGVSVINVPKEGFYFSACTNVLVTSPYVRDSAQLGGSHFDITFVNGSSNCFVGSWTALATAANKSGAALFADNSCLNVFFGTGYCYGQGNVTAVDNRSVKTGVTQVDMYQNGRFRLGAVEALNSASGYNVLNGEGLLIANGSRLTAHPGLFEAWQAPSGGWAGSLGLIDPAGVSTLGRFGWYGNGGALTYAFIGTDYLDPPFMVSPTKVGLGVWTSRFGLSGASVVAEGGTNATFQIYDTGFIQSYGARMIRDSAVISLQNATTDAANELVFINADGLSTRGYVGFESGFATRLALNNNNGGGTLIRDTGGLTVEQGAAGISYFNNTGGVGSPSLTIGPGYTVLQRNAIAATDPTSSMGFIANNVTVATIGSQVQNSPSFTASGSGWASGSGTSKSVAFGWHVKPVAGVTAPTGIWTLQSVVDSTTTTNLTISSSSGWTGTGANVLYDDGTFRASTSAGLWATNAGAGTISPIGNAGIDIPGNTNTAPNTFNGTNNFNGNVWIGGQLNTASNAAFGGTVTATNGFIHQFKTSFSTNFTCVSTQSFYFLNGTNQLITLPTAASVAGKVYRFSTTNGYGSFVITNAADGAKIRDGVSLSYTNIGINEVGFISDGSNWWLASKGKQIFPSASWSLTNNITPVQDVITNIPFTTLEFNNSQGIALRTKAGYTGATELAITNAGTYMLTFSAVLKGSAGGSKISIWLRKDGADVARTRTDQAFSGATAQQCMTVNYFVQVDTSPHYFELCAASHDASPPTIESAAANPTGYTAPAMPGVIVTINRVSDTWP